jgi:Domain of unknown function (DUF1918)
MITYARERRQAMRAAVGDELVVRGRHVDDHDRTGVIIEVQGGNGAPPYRVRWTDGRESVFFPSTDTEVEHLPSKRQGSTVANR